MYQPRLHYVDCMSPLGPHKMAYYEWGQPFNPKVLLCVHGLTRTGRDFDRLAERLASEYRVICPDVVGRGASDWLKSPNLYTIPQYVTDMMTLISRLQMHTLHWFGTSMGGIIGMAMAAMPASPIQRLLLNDIGPSIDLGGLARIGSYVGLATKFPCFNDAVTYIKKVASSFGVHSESDWVFLTKNVVKQLDDGTWILSYDPDISVSFRSSTPEMLRAAEASMWLAYDMILCPTLVVRGAQSDLLSPATAQLMSLRGPRAKIVEIPNVGHAPTFLSEDQIQIAVDFFIK